MSLIYSFKSLKRSECKKWMREHCVLGDIRPIQYKTSPTVFAVVGRGRTRSVDSFDAEIEAYRINKARKTFHFGIVQFDGRTMFEENYPNKDYSDAVPGPMTGSLDLYGRPTSYRKFDLSGDPYLYGVDSDTTSGDTPHNHEEGE